MEYDLPNYQLAFSPGGALPLFQRLQALKFEKGLPLTHRVRSSIHFGLGRDLRSIFAHLSQEGFHRFGTEPEVIPVHLAYWLHEPSYAPSLSSVSSCTHLLLIELPLISDCHQLLPHQLPTSCTLCAIRNSSPSFGTSQLFTSHHQRQIRAPPLCPT